MKCYTQVYVRNSYEAAKMYCEALSFILFLFSPCPTSIVIPHLEREHTFLVEVIADIINGKIALG